MGKMNSLGVSVRNIKHIVVLAALVIATIMPALLSALVSAAQVTERSIAVTNSSKAAQNVTYTVEFTTVGAAGAFVVDFCENTPIIGQTCDAPGGFTAAAAASTTTGFTDVTPGTSKVVVAGDMDAAEEVSVALTGITNPTASGPLYARIVTFDTEANALLYTSTAPGANKVDDGGVAISITDTVGVSGAVLETMTFCAADQTITANCANAAANPPVLSIGETVGSAVALDAGSLSTGEMFAQISTNAASGATINLKSSTECGGLKRAEATACDITPATSGGVAAGQAKIGLLAEAAADTGANPTGTFQAINGYNASTYLLNWVNGNATGVSSPYGDPVLDTNGAPANNKNMKLTFGVSISNTTPAGLYSADLSLIATGKF